MPDQYTTTTEEWRDIAAYNGLYAVSDWGRVRRNKTLGGKVINRLLRPWIAKRNHYPMVTLRNNPVQTNHTVHSLVAYAFLGDPPPNCEINHIDGIRHHSHLQNLEYLTQVQNVRHGRGTKLTEAQVREMRLNYTGAYGELGEMSRKYNIDRSHLCAILKGKWWKLDD